MRILVPLLALLAIIAVCSAMSNDADYLGYSPGANVAILSATTSPNSVTSQITTNGARVLCAYFCLNAASSEVAISDHDVYRPGENPSTCPVFRMISTSAYVVTPQFIEFYRPLLVTEGLVLSVTDAILYVHYIDGDLR